jgi:nitrate reductase molybdenum cofactor assembly chaperone NarJ/NarW
MIGESVEKRLFQLFAELLDYPKPGLADAALECEVLASMRNPVAAALLHEFVVFVEQTHLGRLEELYTGVFELNAACHPYVGYHLFGESYKRSVFLLELKERYRAHGFDAGIELPDHVVVLLRFLAHCDDAILCQEFVQDALLPALGKMVSKDEDEDRSDDDSPGHLDGRGLYQRVLQALQLVLQTRQTQDGETGAVSTEPDEAYYVVFGEGGNGHV